MSKFDAICVQLAVNIAHAPLMQKKAPICEEGTMGRSVMWPGKTARQTKPTGD